MIDVAAFTALLGAKRIGSFYIAACPACGYPGALSIRSGHTAPLITCHAGCSREAVIRAIPGHSIRRMPDDTSAFAIIRAPQNPLERTQAALALWRRSAPAPDTLAQTYLTSRGLALPIPPTLRFLRARHKASGRVLPCMIAAVTRVPDRNVVAIHRTFLKNDGTGKTDLGCAKMTLGPVGGAAVRLAPANMRMGVAEGIETALSAMMMTEIPSWAALNAGGLATLRLPALPLASEVVIFADRDPVGMRAAESAAVRWRAEGRTVRIELPAAPANDFNDALRAQLANA